MANGLQNLFDQADHGGEGHDDDPGQRQRHEP